MPSSERLPAHGTWPPGLLADFQIKHMAEHHQMIDPFEAEPVREVKVTRNTSGINPGMGKVTDTRPHRVVSYGLGHYGYDMRVADEFRVFTNLNSTIIDPKRVDASAFHEVHGDCLIPPNSFALARSLERFKIPRDVLVVVIGKSTYARCGIVVNVTPLEPEWEGYVTLEISNTTPLPARIYANEGIAQCLFYKASSTCRTSYAEKGVGGRGGKYQNQGPEITLPRM